MQVFNRTQSFKSGKLNIFEHRLRCLFIECGGQKKVHGTFLYLGNWRNGVIVLRFYERASSCGREKPGVGSVRVTGSNYRQDVKALLVFGLKFSLH